MYFPRTFLELTNICNQKCDYCPISVVKRPKQLMDFRLAYKIIDNLLLNHYTDNIDFHILEEPLLHDKIFDIISYIRNRNQDVNISIVTNGNLLRTIDLIGR